MARAHERMFDMMHHQMIREDGNRYRNSERNNSYRSESTGSRSLSVGHQRPRYYPQRNFVQDNRSFPAQAQQQQQQHRSVGVRRQDTLAREGIKPLALSRPSKHSENRSLNRKLPSRGGISRSADTEEDAVEDEFSSRTHLGQGWYRITNVESGAVLFRGVQTLIESQNRFTFLTVYNPGRSGNRCQSVVFQFKLVPESENMLNIVLAYESAASYFVLSFDVLQKTISLYYVTGIPISFQVLCQQSSLIWQDSIDHKDINIVNHRFYKYQLQVDNSHLSVHLNGTSIYTKEDCETLIQSNLKTSTIPSFERSADLSIGYFGFLLLPNQQIFLKEMELKSNLLGNVSSVPITTATIIPKKPEKIAASIPTVLTPIVPTETHKSASASLESGKLTNNLLIEFENKKTSNQSERLRQRLLDLKYDHNIIDTILQDIFTDQLNISFEDIAGLAEPKRMLNEAIILPFIMPEYFTGFCQPWKGILLFGPPGTGKTLLAKAVANLNHCTFFNCSTANLISKWRGDSEKLIKCLFEAARIAAPSILFFDEIDALVTSRGSDNEHEASRRMKNEIFSQMDGLQSNSSSTSDQPRVVVLATTNCPWDLDPAILRRLEKRVYIPLPDSQSRSQHFELCLRAMKLQYGECKTETSEEENKQALVKYLSNATDGYSGADIVLVCREAAMIPMRKLLSSHTVGEIQKRRSNGNLEIAAIAREDFDEALKKTKLSIQPEAKALCCAGVCGLCDENRDHRTSDPRTLYCLRFVDFVDTYFPCSHQRYDGRASDGVDGEEVRLKSISYWFFASDFIGLFIQAGGAGILSGVTSQGRYDLGQSVFLAGLVIQLFFFSIFIYMMYQSASGSNFRMWDVPPLQPIYQALFYTSGLIYLRNLYRIVEYCSGRTSYVQTEEWVFFVFETIPIFLVMGIYSYYHFDGRVCFQSFSQT